MTSGRKPPQQAVDIPDHLRHGTSYVHRHYKCRCRRCQNWRRRYDQTRDQVRRHGAPQKRKRLQNGGWYVCVIWGEARGEHEYGSGNVCIRCSADRATEEHWEERWRSTS